MALSGGSLREPPGTWAQNQENPPGTWAQILRCLLENPTFLLEDHRNPSGLKKGGFKNFCAPTGPDPFLPQKTHIYFWRALMSKMRRL